jgi:hypothetical protein
MRHPTRTAVSLVAVAAVGFGACSTGDDPQPETLDVNQCSPDDDGGNTRPVGPTFSARGVPQGWRHDPEGARAAAVSAVGLTGEIARAGFITRGDMIEQFASRRFAYELTETTDQQLGELSEALGEDSIVPPQITWTEVPLSAQVDDADDHRARVAVWSVVVVATPDVGVPRQAWRTVTVDLVWETDDWKVDGWSVAPGPTPALAPAAAISSAGEVITAVEWPAANSDTAEATEGGG